MPAFDLDLTDPRPAAVEAAMSEAVKTANGKARVGLLTDDPADYKKFLASEFKQPEGVMMWLSDKGRVESYPPTPRGTLLGVVWRTTALGRTVRIAGRRIEPFQEGVAHRFGPPYRPWPALCHLDPDHAVTRQFKGGEPEVIAVCACGEVGPPDKLAWEAEGVCGPCHDHKEDTGEHLPPVFGLAALRTEGQIRRIGWMPSGKRLAAWEWFTGGGYGHASSLLAMWERGSGRCTHPVAGGTVATLPRSKAASGTLLKANGLLFFPAKGGPIPISRPTDGWDRTAFHGTTAVRVTHDGSVLRRDLAGDNYWEPVRMPPHSEAPDSFRVIAFGPKGDRVAAGRGAGVVEVVDLGSGTETTIRPALSERDLESRMHAIAFSPDGRHVAAAIGQSGFVEDPSQDWYGWGGTLLLFDVEKGECVAQFPRERDDILCVAFSPDGSLLFSGATDCQIRVIDVAKREELAVLCGHVGGVNHLAFSPDGATLASAGSDGLARLWPWRKILGLPEARKKR